MTTAAPARTCPDHPAMRLQFGFSVRTIEEPDGRKYSESRPAWFCLAQGCRYKRLEGTN